jgi:hypothetical protein
LYKSKIVSFIKNWSLQTKKNYNIWKVFFLKLSVVKPVHDTACLMINCWKMIHNYLGTNEGSILNVHQSDSFGALICLQLREGFFRRGWLIKKTLSNEELSIVLRRHMNVDRHQKAEAIDWLAVHDVILHWRLRTAIHKLQTRTEEESLYAELSRSQSY